MLFTSSLNRLMRGCVNKMYVHRMKDKMFGNFIRNFQGLYICRYFRSTGGALFGTFGGVVWLGCPNPDSISDQICNFLVFFFRPGPLVQRPDNFIRWIWHYSVSKLYFTLNVEQGFSTLPNLTVVGVCIFACTRRNTEIFAQIETVG